MVNSLIYIIGGSGFIGKILNKNFTIFVGEIVNASSGEGVALNCAVA